MRNVHTSEKILDFFEFYQFLQTIHQELLSNSQVVDKSDQEKTFFCMK
jgi:hypothetical protein